MTREEAIEKIEKYQCKRVGTVSESELEEALNMAIEALEQETKPSEVARDIATIIENEQDMRVIALQQEPKWIPVSERMPKETGEYLVSGKMKYSYEKEYETFVDLAEFQASAMLFPKDDGTFKLSVDGFFETYNDWYEGQDEYEIVAWQEVPEPYEEAEQ